MGFCVQFSYYMLTTRTSTHSRLLLLCAVVCILAHNKARRATHGKEAATLDEKREWWPTTTVGTRAAHRDEFPGTTPIPTRLPPRAG